jgi:hypothetical protein
MHDLHDKIIRKYHTLCRMVGLTDDERLAMLSANYGVESSLQLETHDLIDVCGWLQKMLDQKNGNTKNETLDKLRKQCLASLCSYIDTKNIQTANKIAYAKQMACRSAQKDNFNRLTAAELRGITGYFNSERKAFEGAKKQVINQQPSRQPIYFSLPVAEA